MKKYLFLSLAIFAVCVIFLTCKKEVSVAGISLDKKMLELFPGDSITLVAIIQPDNAANNRVIWTSSNPEIATVSDNGFVRIINFGGATINVKTQDGNFEDSCVLVDFRLKYVGDWYFVRKHSSQEGPYYYESTTEASGKITLIENEYYILIDGWKMVFMDKEHFIGFFDYETQGKFYGKDKVSFNSSGGSMSGYYQWWLSVHGTKK